jgi:hypothetical protein
MPKNKGLRGKKALSRKSAEETRALEVGAAAMSETASSAAVASTRRSSAATARVGRSVAAIPRIVTVARVPTQ